MPLHLNKTGESMTNVVKESFREWDLWMQRTFKFLMNNLPSSENDIISKQIFLRHPDRVDQAVAGTAITLTKKLGQFIINAVGSDREIVLPAVVFSRHHPRIDEIVAGTGITLTRKLGRIVINSSSVATTYFEPVTNGDADFPEVVFNAGDIVMHEVPI